MYYVPSETRHFTLFSHKMPLHCPTCFFKEPSCKERERKEKRKRKNKEEEEHVKNQIH